jgi:hypothetical protein
MPCGDNVCSGPFCNTQHRLELPGLRDIVIVHKEDIFATSVLGTSVPGSAQISVRLPQDLPSSLLPPLPGQLLEESNGIRIRAAIVNKDNFKVPKGLPFNSFNGLLEKPMSVVVDYDNRSQRGIVRVLPGGQGDNWTMDGRAVAQIRQQLAPLPLVLLHSHLWSTQQY